MQLFVHSNYSFFESNLSISNLLENFSKIGQKYATITDKNNIYGMWEFINLSKQLNIFPIVGVHIAPRLKQNIKLTNEYNTINKSGNIDIGNNIYTNGGFLMFLRSIEGYHSFNSIISSSTNKKSFNEVYDTISKLSNKNELDNIIFISLTTNVYNILKYLSIPKDNLYFGLIEDIFTKKPFLSSSTIKFFEKLDFPNPIFLTKIFFESQTDDDFIDLLYTLKLNRIVKRKNQIFNKRKPFFESFSSICKFYNLSEDLSFLKSSVNPYNILSNKAKSKLIKSIENAKNFYSLFSEIKPKKPIFPSFYKDADIKLKEICFSKLKDKNLQDNQTYITRLNYELSIIAQKEFSSYFLFVFDLLKYAKENKIEYVGRGSAASSLVSYLLEITEVDPISLNLYFERFLNPERKTYPDIDIDFSWKERDKLFIYLFKKYPSNCCMVSTTLKMNLRGAFRNSAKFYGIDSRSITKYSKLIPSFFSTANINKINDLLSNIGIEQKIIEMTIKLFGQPYAKGVHPGGIVLSSPDIFSSTPFLYAKKGVPISHFDLNYIEDAGLIKIDILSQRALQVLQDSIENIRSLYNKDFKLNFEMANNDSKTWEMIRKGDCRGCFYIESAAMINLLQDLDVKNFLELVAASSVIRPGVSDSGMKDEYILRKRKFKKTEYEIPELKNVLDETYGIMIYQEDVLKVASQIGRLSLSEADLLRKAMSGKSRSKAEIRRLKEKFINGGLSQNYSITSLEKVWNQIESFAGYAFCKAHSASYAVLSVKLAYIKAHFPQIFYAAILNNFGGYYPSIAYNILAIIEKIPIDICKLKSARKHSYYDGKKIVIGLINFFFLNENEKEVLIAFSDYFKKEKECIIAKFIFLSKFEKQKILKLIQIGYFSEFYESRHFAKIVCESLFLEKERKIDNLILKEKEFENLKIYFTENIFNLYYYRYKYLGIFTDATPFDILQKMIEKKMLNDFEIAEFNEYKDSENFYNLNKKNWKLDEKNYKVIGWLIIYRSAVTKDGKLMGFATFFDGKGFLETVLFPNSYENYYNLLKYYNFFKLDIEIEKNTSISFIINKLEPFLPGFMERLNGGDYARDYKKTETNS